MTRDPVDGDEFAHDTRRDDPPYVDGATEDDIRHFGDVVALPDDVAPLKRQIAELERGLAAFACDRYGSKKEGLES